MCTFRIQFYGVRNIFNLIASSRYLLNVFLMTLAPSRGLPNSHLKKKTVLFYKYLFLNIPRPFSVNLKYLTQEYFWNMLLTNLEMSHNSNKKQQFKFNAVLSTPIYCTRASFIFIRFFLSFNASKCRTYWVCLTDNCRITDI